MAGIKKRLFLFGDEKVVDLHESEIARGFDPEIMEGRSRRVVSNGPFQGNAFVPLSRNLRCDAVVGEGAHAGNVRRDLKEIGETKIILILIPVPVRLQNVEIFFQPDEDTLFA